MLCGIESSLNETLAMEPPETRLSKKESEKFGLLCDCVSSTLDSLCPVCPSIPLGNGELSYLENYTQSVLSANVAVGWRKRNYEIFYTVEWLFIRISHLLVTIVWKLSSSINELRAVTVYRLTSPPSLSPRLMRNSLTSQKLDTMNCQLMK